MLMVIATFEFIEDGVKQPTPDEMMTSNLFEFVVIHSEKFQGIFLISA